MATESQKDQQEQETEGGTFYGGRHPHQDCQPGDGKDHTRHSMYCAVRAEVVRRTIRELVDANDVSTLEDLLSQTIDDIVASLGEAYSYLAAVAMAADQDPISMEAAFGAVLASVLTESAQQLTNTVVAMHEAKLESQIMQMVQNIGDIKIDDSPTVDDVMRAIPSEKAI